MATGFNFRATSGYVTDGAGETYVLAETYPTTRGGSTFGWTASGAAGRDRNAGVDRRVAGINFVSTAITSRTFRIDLPSAGTYEFRCAQGDYSFPQNGTLVVTDGTNTLLSLPSNGTTSGQFRDAANNKYSAAGWPGSNAAVELVFPGTLCHIVLSTAGNDAALAHVSLVQVGGSVGSPWNYYAPAVEEGKDMITLTTPPQINSVLGGDAPVGYDKLVIGPFTFTPLNQDVSGVIAGTQETGA